QGIEQVSHAMAAMEKVTQNTAATAEESASASEELNAQAEAAVAVVAKLDSSWRGSSNDHHPVAAAGSPAFVNRSPRLRSARSSSMAPEHRFPLRDGARPGPGTR